MDGYNGAILAVDERDFLLGGDVAIANLPPLNTTATEFNQQEFKDQYGNCLCTVYAPMGVSADNLDKTFTNTERERLSDIRYNMDDFNPAVGGYLHEGVNAVRRYLKTKGIPATSIRLASDSDDFYHLLEMGYRINIGMRIKEEYVKDTQSDGVLNSFELGKTRFGHSTTIKKEGGDYLIVDNYKGVMKFNKVKLPDLVGFIKSGIVYKWAYVIYADTRSLYDKHKQKVMEGINIEEAKKAFENGIWNGKNPTETATREEVATMIQRALDKLKK